jgi:hypothetical protein
MKCLYHQLLIVLLLLGLTIPIYAQSPVYIGTIEDVAATYKMKAQAAAKKANASEMLVSHPLPKNQKINLKLKSGKKEGATDLFFGEVNNTKHSNFYLKIAGREVSGAI